MIVHQKSALRTERLREWREKRGMSQRELARLCGIGDAQVSKYENGHTDPSATYLRIMAEVLQVSADYLLGLTDDPRGHLGDSLSAEERQLLDALAVGDGPVALKFASEILSHQSNK